VPLSFGKNKIQLIANLGGKQVIRNLSYTRTATAVGAGTAMMITYIGTSVIILVLFGLIILGLRRRRSKKEREEQERLAQHAPVHL
jgi:heme/copper-type cytochrome/quinol oxidase subunit 2